MTVMIARKPLAGECKLLGPDGSIIFRGDFSHAMEQYVPDSIARRKARADVAETEAQAAAATRTLNDAVAETVNMITARTADIVRRFDAYEQRMRQRAKDAAAKGKAGRGCDPAQDRRAPRPPTTQRRGES